MITEVIPRSFATGTLCPGFLGGAKHPLGHLRGSHAPQVKTSEASLLFYFCSAPYESYSYACRGLLNPSCSTMPQRGIHSLVPLTATGIVHPVSWQVIVADPV
jgi:hypothetical protein